MRRREYCPCAGLGAVVPADFDSEQSNILGMIFVEHPQTGLAARSKSTMRHAALGFRKCLDRALVARERAMRWLTWFDGIQYPDGQMPRDMRLTFSRHRAELQRAVEVMIAWEPERITLAHGRWYDVDATSELRRAFRWLLDQH